MTELTPASDPLCSEFQSLIDSTTRRAPAAVNAELTLLYWQVGKRIHVEILYG